ncbi:MAG: CBS domain-containing protein [Actinomycetota bacterium]
MAFTATSGLHDAVSRLMSWPVASVAMTATLREVTEALAANEIGAAVVYSGDHFVGVVSERDVSTHIADGANPDHLLVEEMVTLGPVTVSPNDTVLAAARAMLDAGVRHVPVVNDEDDVVGMVSLRDVAAVLLREVTQR